MKRFVPGQRVHIIGIGGFGMSAIARILLLRGMTVTGSDRQRSELATALVPLGATIYTGHSAEYIRGAHMVIATSAAPDDHVEIVAARAAGIPVYRRRDVLAALMEGHKVIAVAGTHGKTTTTAMIVHLLRESGRDPSYIVGGVMPNTGTNAGLGTGGLFVIEADEYGHMFHGINPDIAVLTSLEYDHPDYFATETDMRRAFADFLVRLPPNGRLIVCADDRAALALAREVAGQREVISYGLDNPTQFNLAAVNTQIGASGSTTFEVQVGFGHLRQVVASARLTIPGLYNVRNALAALAVVDGLGLFIPDAASLLRSFASTGRRFELRADVGGVAIIDDYAHHPTAIRMTVEAARQRYPQRMLWVVWQPHMYSRTQRLIDDYATAFADADYVLVTDIYAAREEPIPGVDASWAAAHLRDVDARASGSLQQTVRLLRDHVSAPAVILILSAGNAPQIGQDYLASIQEG